MYFVQYIKVLLFCSPPRPHLEAFSLTMANALCDWSSWSRHSRTTESMSLARSYASSACSNLNGHNRAKRRWRLNSNNRF